MQYSNRIINELQHIISGNGKVVQGGIIQAIASYLRAGETTSAVASEDKYIKKEETKKLIAYIHTHHLWINTIQEENYLLQGAEQKVYIKDEISVLKLNDAIYYATWYDYFINLLLNNYFFPNTAYQLLGFYKS